MKDAFQMCQTPNLQQFDWLTLVVIYFCTYTFRCQSLCFICIYLRMA